MTMTTPTSVTRVGAFALAATTLVALLLAVMLSASALVIARQRSSVPAVWRSSEGTRLVGGSPTPAAIAPPANPLPVTIAVVASAMQAAAIQQELNDAAILLSSSGVATPTVIFILSPASLAASVVTAANNPETQVIDLRAATP
jgi:hypothetical protein